MDTVTPGKVKRIQDSPQEARAAADVHMLCMAMLDPRFSDEQLLEIARRITAPYIGDSEEVAQ